MEKKFSETKIAMNNEQNDFSEPKQSYFRPFNIKDCDLER